VGSDVAKIPFVRARSSPDARSAARGLTSARPSNIGKVAHRHRESHRHDSGSSRSGRRPRAPAPKHSAIHALEMRGRRAGRQAPEQPSSDHHRQQSCCRHMSELERAQHTARRKLLEVGGPQMRTVFSFASDAVQAI
jgi:hypothetical protein